MAFEGYDTVAVLAEVLRTRGADPAGIAAAWPAIAVEGTRGPIRFTKVRGIGVWQWARPPVQVAEKAEPADPDRFRILQIGRAPQA
ncbi:hypothetical protein AB0I28_13960 [Phytomonospora sp. NPDC050363]|uniref:hypothetical protein n=1 Tax=Phytomonospora sp. NPDC050363 TaxID=3155642 RepID=UPI0033DEA651